MPFPGGVRLRHGSSLALGLGIILITLSVCVSGAAALMNEFARRRHQAPMGL